MAKLLQQLEIDRCPHCRVDSPMFKMMSEFETTARIGSRNRKWRIYSCGRCGGVVSAAAPVLGAEVTELYPSPRVIDAAIPEPARVYLMQASDTLHAPAG